MLEGWVLVFEARTEEINFNVLDVIGGRNEGRRNKYGNKPKKGTTADGKTNSCSRKEGRSQKKILVAMKAKSFPTALIP